MVDNDREGGEVEEAQVEIATPKVFGSMERFEHGEDAEVDQCGDHLVLLMDRQAMFETNSRQDRALEEPCWKWKPGS